MIPGCTVSKEISGGDNYISIFSLAKGTDISAEIYPYHKMLIVSDGTLTICQMSLSHPIRHF